MGRVHLAYYQGDYGVACSYLEECLSICQEIGNRSGMARSFSALGLVVANQGDCASALSYY